LELVWLADAAVEEEGQLVTHEAVDVRIRQVGVAVLVVQVEVGVHDVGGTYKVELLSHTLLVLDGRHQVAVREHAGLGPPARAQREQNQGDLVSADLRQFRHRIRIHVHYFVFVVGSLLELVQRNKVNLQIPKEFNGFILHF